MGRILLLLEHQENRRLLSEWLAPRYSVILPEVAAQVTEPADLDSQPFDLCILDARALDRFWEWVQAKRTAEKPVFLPFLLVTARQDVGYATRHLWQSIDDLITKPIEKIELQARVEILLRSRQFSLQLQTTNQQLQQQIVARHQAEAGEERAIAAQHQSEIQFQRLINSNLIGAIAADIEGNITDANDAFLRMVGYTREDLKQGKIRWNDMTPPEYRDRDRDSIEELRNTGVCNAFEKEYIRADGSRVPVLIGVTVVERSPRLNCVAFVLDITQRKQAEAEMRNALEKERELNELKSRFVSMVSHEFRNPLNLISGTAQLLVRSNNKLSEPKKQELLQRQQAAVNRLIELLDDVLTLGRAEVGKLEFNPIELELEAFCRQLVAEMQLTAKEAHAIALVSPGKRFTAKVDKKLLQQILTNLLSNAIKYSPQGGDITLDLTCQENEAIFRVKDEGIGIPPKDLQRLFESFHRASNVGGIPGTGLGLAVVKQAVELHQGAIAVESEEGVGTTFTVTLPMDR
ncbi:hybrid sensor histidine kinase/response regulator [Chroococcidiopsis sp. CCALA 051]|uniref:sensor histidine kinase n=1 Tax=Chroococcidiopsis sp. CCALA 051 TaxID=869949 RepID=UPI000D0D187D|nr:ATP-binding protein [Chroococcidiopsis sp. CCALA 051]MBE9016408.1 PAS domain S-box protein [Chroococcidiopsidales cyanobacterium LEGE 13417]PSM49984.1 hybrid sensor histidine kinase/response regulator [Chroococcidiopsis sp. CCALA 051]